MAKLFDGTNEWGVEMTREEAEEIARRDVPGMIIAAWASMPWSPSPEQMAAQADEMLPGVIDGIYNGTIRLTPDRRLTTKLIASIGNMRNPRRN